MDKTFAYFFRKRYIQNGFQNYEIYEYLDITYGVQLVLESNEKIFTVLTGDFFARVAGLINTDNEYIYIPFDDSYAIRIVGSHVITNDSWDKIYNKKQKYYIREDNDLKPLLDKYILNIIKENEKSTEEEKKEDALSIKKINILDISNISKMIKKKIISQDKQVDKILTIIHKNQIIVNSNLDRNIANKLKENILICGPTGTGKTEIVTQISNIYKVPMVIEDSSTFSETGYNGRNLSEIFKDLLLAAKGNREQAEKGILVLDEFDKLAEKTIDGRTHVSRFGVQRELLKFCEGSLYHYDDKQFDTSRLTIICVGAFSGITTINNYKNLTEDDFVKFGILPELIARLPSVVILNALQKEDIKKILKESEISSLKLYEEFFNLLEIDYNYSNEVLDWIADQVLDTKMGARKLKGIVDNILNEALFEIFSNQYSEISLVKPKFEDENPYILKRKIN